MYEFKITIKIMSLERRRNLRQNLTGNGHIHAFIQQKS